MSGAAKPGTRLRLRLEDEKEIALRAERVSAIMRIVKDAGGTATKQDAEAALIFHDTNVPYSPRAKVPYLFKSKAQKVAARSLMEALKRLASVLNTDDLLPAIKVLLPVSRDELKGWAEEIRRSAAVPLPGRKQKNKWKRHAVEAAANFCRQHHVPLMASKNGAFCRLAAVFDREAYVKAKPKPSSYFHACRDYLRVNPA